MFNDEFSELTEKEQREKGRYTLGAAAAILAEAAGEKKQDIPLMCGTVESTYIDKLIAAVQILQLPAYLPERLDTLESVPDNLGNILGGNPDNIFDGFPISMFVQVFWNDLNEWLEINSTY